MNTALQVVLIVIVVGISSSFPQQGNAPPGRPYRDTSSQVNPPGSLEGPQIEDLHSTDDLPKGSTSTKDVPKTLERQSRQTKDVPKDSPAAGTKDIPKDRVTRQAESIPQPPSDPPQVRPALPGSAGQPQVQPIRPDRVTRQTKDVPKDSPAAGTKDIPKNAEQSRVARQAVPIPQPLPGSPQTRPALSGSAGQPQVQPIRAERVTRQTKDLPKEDTRPKRQAQPIPEQLPGSAGQPQTQPPRQTRQTKDVPKDAPAAGTKDIPKDSLRNRRDTDHASDDAVHVPIPQTLPAKVDEHADHAGQHTKDVPKSQE